MFNGFVHSADRFANRFADRCDDLYEFVMIFYGVCLICNCFLQSADRLLIYFLTIADRFAHRFNDLDG